MRHFVLIFNMQRLEKRKEKNVDFGSLLLPLNAVLCAYCTFFIYLRVYYTYFTFQSHSI